MAAGLAALLAVGSTATAQEGGAGGDQYFWPHRTFFIPVRVDRIVNSDNKPAELQLYSSLNHGPWQAGKKLPLNSLQNLGDGKKGFQFTADKDGDYEFSVQYWYSDGTSSPQKADELRAMINVVIDTTPPTVRIVAGANGVEWTATDENLDPQKISLECKRHNSTEWKTIPDRLGRPFKPADTYAWNLKPEDVLDVRVVARDRAGNENYSPVVRVPGDKAVGTALPRGAAGGGSDWPPSRGGPGELAPSGNLPQPRIEYVNAKEITVDYTIQRMGRSGIKAADLYVLREKEPGGWKLAESFKVDLQPADREQTLSLKYKASDEGVYGFYVVPESGAGVKADPPRKNEPPMMYVVVDTTAPYVRIQGVRVIPGGARGALVEITWEVADQNLMTNPVSLEYSIDKNAVQWNEIKYRLDNNLTKTTGRYAWEVPDENPWKFYVRIRAVDKAGNTGTHVWGQTESKPDDAEVVIVDLEKPSAGITGVRGGAGGGAAPEKTPEKKSNPPKRPTTPSTIPAPSAPPSGGPPVPGIP